MSERIEGSYDVNDSRQTVESVRGDDDYCGADDYHPGGSEAERPNGRCRENGLVLTAVSVRSKEVCRNAKMVLKEDLTAEFTFVRNKGGVKTGL